jgi:tetratricopeptide (TPR) repeat protein
MRLAAASFLIVTILFINSGQNQNQKSATAPTQSPAGSEIQMELERVAHFYRTGNFIEAQRHAERAVSLDPSNRTALTFLARVSHQRYKPGDETPENIKFARQAIATYQRLLDLDSQNEDAFKSVAVLYRAIREEDLLRGWLLQRAQSPQFPYDKRAEAYAMLAGRFWDCSFKITELPDKKVTDEKGSNSGVIYLRPIDALEFEKIKQCVASGLEMADMALALEPNSESGWSYKMNLLMEKAKLAEMEGLAAAKADYLKQMKQAQLQLEKLAAERRQREGGDSPEPKSDARSSPTPGMPRP